MPSKPSRRRESEEPRHHRSALWGLVMLMLPAAAFAQVEQRFRLQGTWSNPTDELREHYEEGDVFIEAEDAFGGRLAYEVLFGDRLGVELAAGTVRHDVAVEAELVGFPTSRLELGRIRVTPITASLLYHLAPHSKTDFYVGGGAAYVDYGDFELTIDNAGEKLSVDADLTYTLQAGLDLKLNERWRLTGNVQWIDTKARFSDDPDADDSLPISPVVVGAGVALRF